MNPNDVIRPISIQPAGGVITKLVVFSLMMIIIPISFYFASKAFLFEGIFKMSSSTSYFYAAIVAIVTIHVILAMFIYVAWTEDSKPSAKLE